MSQTTYYDAAGYPIFPGSKKHEKMFGPDDLNKLQAIFDACLEETSLSRECEAAESLGSAIIRLYSQGQRDPIVIKAMLLSSFKRRA